MRENEWIATNNEIRFGFIVNNVPDIINVDLYEMTWIVGRIDKIKVTTEME